MRKLAKIFRSSPEGYRWYASPDISWPKALVVSLIPASFCALLLTTPWGISLQNRLERPIEFEVRHLLKRDPPLDPHIKIYGFDDTTLHALDEDDMTLEQWLSVLKTFVDRKPRAVFIDKFFGTPRGIAAAPEFVKGLKALPFPVITGGFVSDIPISDRPTIELGSADNLLTTRPSFRLGQKKIYSYGPDVRVKEAFSHIGHLVYQGDSVMNAFIPISANEAMPMASLLVGGKREWKKGVLYIDSRPVSLDSHGRVLVNLPNPKTYFSKTFVLSSLLRLAKEGRTVQSLPDDAVVVILPAMYTGAGDLVPTAFGLTSGGYVQVSLINSVLTGNWLTVARGGWLMVLLAGLLGTALAVRFGTLSFFILLVLIGMVQIAAGLLAFSYEALELPWLFCVLAGTLSALVTFAQRSWAAEEKGKRLRLALHGSFSPAKLDVILKRPSDLVLDPSSRLVTIMFIDIVGFSLVAERQSPAEAFNCLRTLMAKLSDTVHAFDGTVDKTLGDGLLCFFGYSPSLQQDITNHSEQALRCAIRIQADNMQKTVEASKLSRQEFPLRIGINTAEIYIGDLGSSQSIDLTLIGAGVNYAKRLETACESHSILLGANSFKMLKEGGWNENTLKPKQLQIKHHSELFVAYECDPLERYPELRNQIALALQKYAA